LVVLSNDFFVAVFDEIVLESNLKNGITDLAVNPLSANLVVAFV
jgi:hypothetical protein